MTETSITIAGGGIAGLAAALGLARIGRHCVVLERSRAFETAGAGLQLGPNAVRALQWLGAWGAIEASTFAPDAIIIKDGLSGRTLLRIPLGRPFESRFGQPYRVAHRADLLNGLLETARQSSLIKLRAATEVVHPDESVGVLIGADGIRSTIRGTIRQDLRPRLSGHVIYRALIPRNDISPSVQLWLCAGGHVVHYPVSGGKMLNVVAVVDGHWRSDEWSEPAQDDEIAGSFATSCDDLRGTLASAGGWHKWAGAELPTLSAWSYGSTVLTGDAAHAALPYLAQGAAMALEDAVVLAMSLHGSTSTSAAFRAYETARRPRVEKLRLASSRLASIYHAKGAARLGRNLLLGLTSPERFLDRLSWLYRYDPAAFIIR